MNRVIVKAATLEEKRTGEKYIRLVFPFNKTLIEEIKKIIGRKFNEKDKSWHIPLSLTNCFKVQELKFQIHDDLKRWANYKWKKLNRPITIDKIEGFNGTLKKFQKEGVVGIERFDGETLLADDMGLGKTIQSLAWSLLHDDLKPVIIVCPSTLKGNWKLEIQEFLPDKTIQVLSGQTPYFLSKSDFYIINYDILRFWVKNLKNKLPKILIIDEAHYASNPGALRSMAVMKLRKGIPHVISCTGTPIENHVKELWNIVRIINPSLFPDHRQFMWRYGNPKMKKGFWTFEGVSHAEELNQILRENIMIRRLKSEVEEQLPEKTFSIIPLKITNRIRYDNAENNYIDFVLKDFDQELRKKVKSMDDLYTLDLQKVEKIKQKIVDKASNHLGQRTKLKTLCSEGKTREVIKWIYDFLESGNKLLIFAIHKKIIERIYGEFKNISVKIDGSTPQNKRQDIVKQFQTNDKIKLFIGNMIAAGVGLTLTAAHHVAIIEYPDKPGLVQQSIDRAHRIGAKFTVHVHLLAAEDTIEESIAKLLKEKQKIINSVIDGKYDRKEMFTAMEKLLTS